MITDERWGRNWVVVSPPGARRFDLDRSFRRRRALLRAILALPPGTPVVLCSSALGAIGRATFASKAHLVVEREYLAFPSARAPAYLVEDARAPVHWFVRAMLVAPPRTRTIFATPLGVGLGILRLLGTWRVVRVLAPGRMLIGRRK
jgi:hypothetical protein